MSSREFLEQVFVIEVGAVRLPSHWDQLPCPVCLAVVRYAAENKEGEGEELPRVSYGSHTAEINRRLTLRFRRDYGRGDPFLRIIRLDSADRGLYRRKRAMRADREGRDGSVTRVLGVANNGRRQDGVQPSAKSRGVSRSAHHGWPYSLTAFPSQVSFCSQVPDAMSTATPTTLMILGLSQTNARDNLLFVTMPFTISSTICRAVTRASVKSNLEQVIPHTSRRID